MMVVQVLDRGASGWDVNVKAVEIADNCQVCGKKRATPVLRHFHEDGHELMLSCWENPCGHLDSYAACLLEAEELKKLEAEELKKCPAAKLAKIEATHDIGEAGA